jgi:hypothetical protein
MKQETRLYKIENIFKDLFCFQDLSGNIYLEWKDCPKENFYEVKKRLEVYGNKME